MEWSVSDEQAADIDAAGNVTFSAAGNVNFVIVTATVTYSYKGNNGQTVTTQKIFYFTKSTETADWDDFK